MLNIKKGQFLNSAKKTIKEQVWNSGKHDSLIRLLKHPEAFERASRYPHHKLLYLDNDEPIPLIWISSTEPDQLNSEQAFIEILYALPTINYDSLLFALTCYQQFNHQEFQKILNNSNHLIKDSSVLDLFLAPSFGYLVYAHQLEQIYIMLTGVSSSEAIAFRKDWNIKRRTTRTMVADIKLDDNRNRSDLIKNRALDQEHFFCFHAPWRSAYLLYTHLLKDIKSEELS